MNTVPIIPRNALKNIIIILNMIRKIWKHYLTQKTLDNYQKIVLQIIYKISIGLVIDSLNNQKVSHKNWKNSMKSMKNAFFYCFTYKMRPRKTDEPWFKKSFYLLFHYLLGFSHHLNISFVHQKFSPQKNIYKFGRMLS